MENCSWVLKVFIAFGEQTSGHPDVKDFYVLCFFFFFFAKM